LVGMTVAGVELCRSADGYGQPSPVPDTGFPGTSLSPLSPDGGSIAA